MVAAGPRPLQVAQQRRPQVHRLQARRLVELVPRRLQPELRRRVPVVRRRLAVEQVVVRVARVVAAAEDVAAALSPARPTRMAPLTRHSLKWPETLNACRRCSSGRRI